MQRTELSRSSLLFAYLLSACTTAPSELSPSVDSSMLQGSPGQVNGRADMLTVPSNGTPDLATGGSTGIGGTGGTGGTGSGGGSNGGALAATALDPDRGPSGSFVTVVGSGFQAGDTVQLSGSTLTTTVLATISLASSAIVAVLPPGLPASDARIKVVRGTSAAPAAGLPFTVTKGNVYYVSPGGNDSAAGSKAAPWRTLSGAASRMAAGDVAYLRDGTYPDRTTLKASGTASAPLSFIGYPGEHPLLTNSSGVTLSITGAYVRLDHLRFTNTTSSAAVAIVAGAHDIRLANSEIFNAGTSGLFVSGDHNEVSGNWIHNNGSRAALDHGMYVEGANNLIRGNRINDNWAYGIQLYNGYGRTAGGNVVELNYIYHNGYGSPTDNFSRYNSAIIVAGAQPDTIIRYNRMCANMHFAIYITDNESGTQLTGNLSCYNGGGGFFLEAAGRTTLSGNVSYNDGGFALMGVPGVTSDQNTFYRAASQPTFQWNAKNQTWAQYRSTSGQDAHSTLDDPHLKSAPTSAFELTQALAYDFCTALIPQLCPP